jgi:cyclase
VLKARIMPTLLFKDAHLVKGVCFDSWRRVGSVMQAEGLQHAGRRAGS